MTICSCCNRRLDTEYAYENNLCPVCERSGCTGLHARHSDQHLDAHEEAKREERQSNATQADVPRATE